MDNREPTSEQPTLGKAAVAVASAEDLNDQETDRIRRRLSDAVRIPVVALGLLLILALPLGLALFEVAHLSKLLAPIIALAVAAGALGFAFFRSERSNTRVSFAVLWLALGGVLAVSGVGLGIASGTFTSEVVVNGPGGTVSVVADDISFDQNAWTVPEGEITFVYTDQEDLVHTLLIEGMEDRMELRVTDQGDSDTATVGLPAGTYTLFCGIRGHREQGMEGLLTVTAAPTESTGGS